MKEIRQTPDLLLLNGHVITVDPRGSVQQAVAIRCSHIQAVGQSDELRPLAGPGTRIIDVQGHVVIPGIIDGHAHMDREGLKKIHPGLEGIRSIPEILAVIECEVASKRPEEWVVFMPIGDQPNFSGVPGNLAEKRYPTRWELDRVSPHNPVYIRGIWPPWNIPPSVSIANSKALQLAGINRHTPSPHSSLIIEKDATGEPTGVIIDHNMFPVTEFTLMRVVPRFTHEDRTKALKDSMRLCNQVGITGVYEGHGVAPEVLQAYKAVWDAGEMTVRSHLVISPTWRSLKEAKSDMSRWGHCVSQFGFGDDMLRLCGVFIQLRGERHVARLRSAELPYTGWAGFAVTYHTWAQFLALTRIAAQHHLRVHTIASTEGEMEDVLRAFKRVHDEIIVTDRRWVIEHVRDVQPSQLEGMKCLGIVCQTIPLTHLWLRGASYLGNQERADRAVPHQDLLRHGIPFALGTDNKPYNPFHTFWAAAVRQERKTGEVIGPRQRLSRMETLRAFTMGGAYLFGREKELGSLEPGKLADLTVLSDDPLKVPEKSLPDLHSILTIVGGQIVHSKGFFGI